MLRPRLPYAGLDQRALRQMKKNASEMLVEGAKLLEPLLLSHDFRFRLLKTGHSSGGQFASGEFTRGFRRLEFHYRYSLGMVTYHLGDSSMGHEEYMRSLLGKPYASLFPGFYTDPLDAFRDLLGDLESRAGEFLSGTDNALRHRIETAHASRNALATSPD